MNDSTYEIKEDGKNGTITVLADRIIRTHKKTFGKDDVHIFPMKSITDIRLDRKILGADLVKLKVGLVSYEWKVKDAEQMVADLQAKMYA